MNERPTTDAIWTQLSAELWRFIRRRVADDHTADDLVQETFVRVHRNLASLEEADRLAAWVYRIARNVVYDHHRQSAGAAGPLADDPTDEVEDAAAGQLCRARQWLGQMIEALPERYRQAVQLAELEELPQQAVADRLGLSISGAKSRIQRGRAMLKEVLQRCCTFEFDRRGNLVDYEPLPGRDICRECEE